MPEKTDSSASAARPEIVFLPVDERFCTRDYFLLLSEASGLTVKTPPMSYLGAKKIRSDMNRLHTWLDENADSGNLLIISLDMLAHGGLIPSRMSLESLETLRGRLKILKKLKDRGCKIYASISVTRTPFYDSAEEEPDYWEYFGRRIYDLSRILAQRSRGETADELLKTAAEGIPSWIIDDYLNRRKRNFAVITRAIDLVAEGAIDFLNVVLDDNSRESLSLAEAENHEARVDSLDVNGNVSIHAGADEANLSLLAKALLDAYRVKPKFKVVYTSPKDSYFIPPYEGSPLFEGVRNHLEAAGGRQVDSDEDIVLLVNNLKAGIESSAQPEVPEDTATYDIVAKVIEEEKGKILGIADVKYANGADNYLVKLLLDRSDIDWERTNFAAWNTAGNTLGTVCAYSIIQYLGAKGLLRLDLRKMATLQAIFFLEHWAFQANVRQDLIRGAKERGVMRWTLIPVEDWAVEYTTGKLSPYKERIETALRSHWNTFRLWFPWHRSFEIGIELD